MGKSYDSPEHQKSMKIYLFAVAGTLIMSYLNELLMYLMFRGEVVNPSSALVQSLRKK